MGEGEAVAQVAVAQVKPIGKAYAAEVGSEDLYDKTIYGHEHVRGDISEVATDEIRKDKLSRNMKMDNEGVNILQVYKR